MNPDVLAQIDIAFCVDLTNSMTPFIEAARAQASRILDELRAAPDVDLRVAFVGYRDVGKLPKGLEVVHVNGFTSETGTTKLALERAVIGSPADNTDAAEAVFSGLVACLNLPWRAGSYRIVVLVGDAPPHGCGATSSPYPDRFEVDPTGLSLDDVANRLEAEGVFLYALGMVPSVTPNHDAVVERAFTRLAIGSGGAYHAARNGTAAMKIVELVSERCLAHLDFDRKLFALTRSELFDVDAFAKSLAATEDLVSKGLMRLRQRGLLDEIHASNGPPRRSIQDPL